MYTVDLIVCIGRPIYIVVNKIRYHRENMGSSPETEACRQWNKRQNKNGPLRSFKDEPLKHLYLQVKMYFTSPLSMKTQRWWNIFWMLGPISTSDVAEISWVQRIKKRRDTTVWSMKSSTAFPWQTMKGNETAVFFYVYHSRPDLTVHVREPERFRR